LIKHKVLSEKYSIIVSSQTDARKCSVVFKISQKAVALLLCAVVFTIAVSTGVIIVSRLKSQQYEAQIAQLNNYYDEQVYLCHDCTSGESYPYPALISTAASISMSRADEDIDSFYSLNQNGLKSADTSYKNTIPEKVTTPRAGKSSSEIIEQQISISMTDAMSIIESQFRERIENGAAEIAQQKGISNYSIVYNGDFISGIKTPDNWADVISVFFTINGENNPKLLTISTQKIGQLSGIYNSMNEIAVSVSDNQHDYINNDAEIYNNSRTLSIDVTLNSLNYTEGAQLYDFSRKQIETLESYMSSDYCIYFSELLGVSFKNTTEYKDISAILEALPNTKGSEVVRAALIRLGSPYSRSKRGSGVYVDCSYFAWWAYNQAGISIPTSSVTQAKYCYDHGLTVEAEDLKPGDLIFWAKKTCRCGRWHEIHHVGIYIGDNKVIEAITGEGCVIRSVWGLNGKTWRIDMYGRPE